MDITALNLTGALALGQRMVISVDGTVRVLEDGEPLQAGDVTLESQNGPNEPQVSVKRFSPEDGEVELDQDIANIFAALEEGEDPTELGDEFATAAGQNGSSLATSGTVERDGEETIPATEFITTGFEALGMSRTQSLSLLEQFRFAQQEPIFVDLSFSALEDALSASVPEDTLLSGQLTATDANNDLLTFSVESGPSNGSLTLNEDGSWQYTPDANYNGPDSFQVIVTDETGLTDTLTVTIDVTPVNDAPVAEPKDRSLLEDQVISGSINATDVDQPVGEPLVFTTDTLVEGLTLNEDGSYEFDASSYGYLSEGEELKIEVPVTVTDDQGATDTTTLIITVTGTNDLPIANADTSAVEENSTVTVDVLANDTDLDDGATFTLDNVSSDKGLVTIVDNKLVFEATGEDFDHLPVGVTEQVVVTYTMSDESGEPITSTATITVTGTNDRPIARNDSGSINEDATLAVDASIGLLKNDSDIDGDNLEVIGIRTGAENASNSTAGTVGSGLTGSFGTLIVNEDGSYNYVADNADSLKAGEQVSETFTYTISDGKGGMDTAALTITVTGTNDGPKATDDSYNESSETLLFSESFEQMINTGRWTVVTGDDLGDWNATNGLEVQRDGLIADATHGDYLAELDAHKNTEISTIIDTSGQDSIRVEFDYNPRQDGNSSSDMVFKIGDTSVTVHADGTLSGANGLDIQISLPDANGWYRVTAELEVQADSTELAFAGDGASDSLGALIDNVIVTGINQPELVTREDEPITIPFAELLANDTDIDGDVLSIVVGSITSEVNGTLSVDYVNETITFTPDQDYNGEATFQYTVTDGNGGEDQATVTLNITPVNDAPELNVDTGEVGEDATLTVGAGNGLLSNDSDVDGDSLNVTGILNGITGTATAVAESGDTVISNDYGTLTIRADGSYSFVADGSDSQALATEATAEVVFTYTASDGTVNQTNTLTITVTGTNDAPQLTADVGEVNEDATLTVSAEDGVLANDSDVDGDSLNVTGILNGTTGTATAVAESGDTVISNDYGTLTIRGDGSYSFVADGSDSQALATGATADVVFSYTASDGTVNQTNTLTITVTGTNDGPVAIDDTYETHSETLLFSESFENMTNTGRWTVVTGDELDDWEATNGLEIQRDGLIAEATDGDYLAELDAHQNTAITTNINTSDQDSVRVEFDYNPRRDGNSSSDMTFKVGDTLVTVHADGSLSGADGLNVQIGQPDANGWYKITAEFEVQGDVTDLTFAGAGASDSYGALLDNITVTGINQSKLVTAEDTSITISFDELLANDTDIDGDELSIVVGSITSATNGELFVDYTNNTIIFTPDTDYNGEATFKYKVTDGNGGEDEAEVTLNITPVNDTPVLIGDLLGEVDEEGSYTITAEDLGYTDVDDTDTGVTFTVGNASNGTILVNGVASSSFTVAQLAAGKVTFKHDGSETTSASFNINVEDGNEDGSTPVDSTFNLTVTPVNDAPELTGDLAAEVDEAGSYTISAADLGYTDVDDTDTGVTFTVGNASNGTILVNGVASSSFTVAQLA
ncbi:tandem-95 repeat protein, partial [Vibrio sp. 10N.222.55.A1]|uniref:tandem-95 repeat protein n=2 Tax=unclassified Vibrio TaxID=2614977 RepID=UPI00354E2CE5